MCGRLDLNPVFDITRLIHARGFIQGTIPDKLEIATRQFAVALECSRGLAGAGLERIHLLAALYRNFCNALIGLVKMAFLADGIAINKKIKSTDHATNLMAKITTI